MLLFGCFGFCVVLIMLVLLVCGWLYLVVFVICWFSFAWVYWDFGVGNSVVYFIDYLYGDVVDD